MQLVSDIKSLHIELTDKCQAQCPMCARNYNGGATRPFIRNGDISLAQFKEWFPKKFLAQLDNFYSCGNYGDPAFASDCLEIYAYVRECNPTVRLAIHTNGGMRNPLWWSKLAQCSIEVIFAIDGFKGKHELYRKNTNFDKVIANMKAFIDAGGTARVDSLVFEHNENETQDFEKYLLALGVKTVNFVITRRFYGMKEYEVHDNDGNVEYTIKPAKTPKFKRMPPKSLELLLDKEFREKAIENSIIDPKCVSEKGIYIDPYGNIFPCCWIAADYLEQPLEEKLPIHILRNLSVENTQEVLKQVGVPNCHDGVLDSNENLFEKLSDFWQGKNKCLTCARQCSKAIIYDNNKYD